MAAIAFSFATTCRDRLQDLRRTLPTNLQRLGEDCEIVLLDYGCPQHCGQWAIASCAAAVAAGKLRVYRDDHATRFIAPHAKNVAHLLAEGQVIVNLDADNYLTNRFLSDLRSIDWTRTDLVHPCNYAQGGWTGRIAVRANAFRETGGYDERLNIGYAYEDIDLVERFRARRRRCQCVPVEEDSVIPTPPELKRAWQLDPLMSLRESNMRHRAMSRQAIIAGRLIANAGQRWGATTVRILHQLGYVRLTGVLDGHEVRKVCLENRASAWHGG